MKISPVFAVILSGLIWLVVGFFLLYKGMFFVVLNSKEPVTIICIVISFLLGYAKARFVLDKTVKRVLQRCLTASTNLTFSDVFTFRYLLIILLMMCIGIVMGKVGLPLLVRGFIDLAVGSALINGAIHYFRVANTIKAQAVKKK